MRKKIRVSGLILAIILLAACATPITVYHSASALSPPMTSRVLVFPPDVIVSSVNAGGLREPNAEWSTDVIVKLNEAIMNHMFNEGIEYVPYGSNEVKDEHMDILRQAGVMMDGAQITGGSTKRFYALGKSSIDALKSYDADYVFFTELDATTSTSGKIALDILLAGFGVGSTDTFGTTVFRVGLFDMRDGQILYSNFDPNAINVIGNLSKADQEKMNEAITHIMAEFPL